MEQASASPVFVGVDVAKDRLDVHVRPEGRVFAVPRDAEGLETLTKELGASAPALVVLETTGGFERTVAAALAGAGLPLAVVNPRQIRDFARAVRSSPSSPNASSRRRGPCRRPRLPRSPSWSRAGARSSR